MTRKVKALALALLTSAAIGGVTASAASAAEIHNKDMSKAHWRGVETHHNRQQK
jgi:Spy/CpxP family protein refolding chaperone